LRTEAVTQSGSSENAAVAAGRAIVTVASEATVSG
jgi:hypothetical protein